MSGYPMFEHGDYVRKISGSWWEGYVVGYYNTDQTEDGVAVQLPVKNGPVQIYPASALEHTEPGNVCLDLRAALATAEEERDAAHNEALEKAAEVAEGEAEFSEEAIQNATSMAILDNIHGVTKSRQARAIATAIRALKTKETPNADK